MSKLESTISELERQLALKKAYQAVKFSLPKNTPEDVAAEIQQRLRELSDGLALSQEKHAEASESSIFSEEEVSVLKMLVASVQAKQSGTPPPAGTVPGSDNSAKKEGASPGGSSEHKPSFGGRARKAKIVTAENIRGEARKFAAPDDEIYVPNSDKQDDHGMVSATHMRKGMQMKIPVDDLEFLD